MRMTKYSWLTTRNTSHFVIMTSAFRLFFITFINAFQFLCNNAFLSLYLSIPF